MKQTLFLIGIGGTGMRCLEAFVHTCAIGMLDNSEINILALDTDLDNGNFSTTKFLDKYGEYDLTVDYKTCNNNSCETKTSDYLNNTALGKYIKSAHYADSALGDFINYVKN